MKYILIYDNPRVNPQSQAGKNLPINLIVKKCLSLKSNEAMNEQVTIEERQASFAGVVNCREFRPSIFLVQFQINKIVRIYWLLF